MDTDEADRWWHCLPPARRVQIHRWIEHPAPTVPQGLVPLPLELPPARPDRKET